MHVVAAFVDERRDLRWVGRRSFGRFQQGRSIAMIVAEAHAVAGAGRCALAMGDATEGRAGLRQALEIFDWIGAAGASDVSVELGAVAATAISRPTSA
jgi:hypothetical protein